MTGAGYLDTRGVLRTPPDGGFAYARHEPSPRLAPFVALVWHVRWDRRRLPPHRQATIPRPAVHLTVEDGEVWLYPPPRRRFERLLQGAGEVIGVRFRPGGARALLDRSVASLGQERLPAATAVAGLDANRLVRGVTAARGDGAALVRTVDDVLTPLLPCEPDPAAVLADRAVALLESDPALMRTAELARRLDVSVRSLHRTFAEHVGVGPGWVARRFRLQEAAVRAGQGARVDWARLAADLGYCDQAHLVRDFTRTVGESPARYAASLR